MKKIFKILCLMTMMTLLLTGCSQKQILNFQKVASFEFNGMNGKGTVSTLINEEVYNDDDFLENLFPDNSIRKAKEKLSEIMEDAEYTFSKETELSNGDEITVNVKFDNELLEKDELTAENEEFTIKVEGLADGTIIDPFEGLKVGYDGVSGKGYTLLDSSGCSEFVKNNVNFGCNKTNISNGDKIIINAIYDEETAADSLVIIENETKEYVVSGLKEPIEIDPFDKLSITYTGASPYIKAAIDSTKCDAMVNEYITLDIEDKYMRNGDTFTVTASYNDYDAAEFGFIVKTSSKTYTVENEAEYVTSLEGLDLSTLKKELDDKLTVTATANQGDYYFAGVGIQYYPGFDSIAEKNYKTSYLVSLKKNFEDKFDGESYNYNRFIQIYEYIVNYGEDNQKKIYVAVFVNNIKKNNDGTISWDIELGSMGSDDYDKVVNTFATSEKEFYNVSEIKED